MKKILCLILICIFLVGCSNDVSDKSSEPQEEITYSHEDVDATITFPDEENNFADVLELVDEHYEIKMFDEYGIPGNIEINHADDFVNMIVSARQIKCEFKFGE